MRALFTCLLLCIVYSAFSQNDSIIINHDNRFRGSISAGYNFTFGQFNYHTSDKFITGQIRSSIGGTISFGKSFGKDWYAGLILSGSIMQFDNPSIQRQILQQYGAANAYNTFRLESENYNLNQLGIEFAKNFRFRPVEIEPFVILGLGEVTSFPGEVYLKNKFKNDNYYNETKLTFEGTGKFRFFLPTFGLHLYKELYRWLYLEAGVSYSVGTYSMWLQQTSSDLENKTNTGFIDVKQPVSILQVSGGVQFRFGKR